MSGDHTMDNLIMAEQMINKCKITERDKYVVCARYFHGKLLKELADELGVSQGRVRQLEQKALRSMRRIAKRDYWDSMQ